MGQAGSTKAVGASQSNWLIKDFATYAANTFLMRRFRRRTKGLPLSTRRRSLEFHSDKSNYSRRAEDRTSTRRLDLSLISLQSNNCRNSSRATRDVLLTFSRFCVKILDVRSFSCLGEARCSWRFLVNIFRAHDSHETERKVGSR